MTVKFRKTRASGDISQTFSTEDGKNYRGIHQNSDGVIKHVNRIKGMHEHATKASNPNEWKHIGSIPETLLWEWLKQNNYTQHQWAINEGGTRCPAGNDPVAHAKLDHGVRSKFLRFFLSRDYSKLHNHTASQRGKIITPSRG